MGMAGELATENTILNIVATIKKKLDKEKHPAARRALKEIGRYALTQFDWAYPSWAKSYEDAFKRGK
jgi:DNA-binding transcriptional regulator YdaS (Cro superfamily)